MLSLKFNNPFKTEVINSIKKEYPVKNYRVVIPRALTLRAVGNKMKTRKSASKRFKITGTGKVIRRQSGKQHLNEKKSRKKKNRLSTYKAVSGKDMVHVIKCLPYRMK